MERRTFVGALATGAFANVPRIVSAQQAWSRRIGFLTAGVLPKTMPAAFRDELREHGWVEGQNLVIERRGGDGNSDRVPVRQITDEFPSCGTPARSLSGRVASRC